MVSGSGLTLSTAVDDVRLPHGLVPRALPETLVYGRDGRLRYRFGNGGPPLDEATLARIVPPLLAER